MIFWFYEQGIPEDLAIEVIQELGEWTTRKPVITVDQVLEQASQRVLQLGNSIIR